MTKIIVLALLAAGIAVATAAGARAGDQPLKVGSQAPDFTRQAADGQNISLKDLRGKKAVVLFFYPKDETTVCTKEACTFRDSYQSFQDLGAEVIGVSGDNKESHEEFANHHKLPFHLISDGDGSLRKLYHVSSAFGMGFVPGRVTFVIDKEGTIRLVFNNMLDGPKHVSEALDTLRSLEKTTK